MPEVGSHPHPHDPDGVTRARAAQLGPDQAQRLVETVALIAEPTRTRILCALLAVEELCVGDLALALDLPDDAVSYALRVLRTAGLVERRREGRLSYYRLADDDTEPALRSTLRELRRLAGT